MISITKRITSWVWPAVGLIALAAIGCSDTEPTPGPAVTTGPDSTEALGRARAGLVAVQSCGELESYVKAIAMNEFEVMGQAVSLPGGIDFGMDNDSAELGAPTAAGGQEQASGGGNDGQPQSTPDFSGTNNQVDGVDEADLVKTNGNHIFTVAGNRLRILKALPAAEAEELAVVELPGRARELFLSDNRLLVYSTGYGSGSGTPISGTTGGGATAPIATTPGVSEGSDAEGAAGSAGSAGGAPDSDAPAPTPAQKPTVEQLDSLRGSLTYLTVFDISDTAAPVVERNLTFEASYASARLIDGKAFTVLRSRLFLPSPWDIGWEGSIGEVEDIAISVDEVDAATSTEEAGASPSGDTDVPATDVPGSAPGKADEVQDTLADAKTQFQAALDAGSLTEWMPKVLDTAGETTTESTLASCASFYKPTIQQGLNLVAVVALDLQADAADFDATITIGQSDTIYANAGSLYVASYTHGYWFWNGIAALEGEEEPVDFSLIHKFNLASGDMSYAASGKAPGRILNQFSLDEHDGALRVATTSGFGDVSSNGVYVLTEQEGTLAQVGSTTNLAQGEEIYSARFIGDKGYVVTFRQVDPLFTLDLSDPTNPAVVGELKIPGFSTYIHPLDDNHLLTIGRDALDQGDWVEIEGIQLQIFDVSDPANPTVAFKNTFGNAGSSSAALYDHRAFAWFADTGLLAVPFSQYGEGGGGIDIGMPVEPVEDPDSDGNDAPVPAEPEEDEIDPSSPPTEIEDEESDPSDWVEPSHESGVKVFSVSTETGITEVGEIDFTILSPENTWRATVERIVRIEDHLYSIGNIGMVVSALSDFSLVAQVLFEEADDSGKDIIIDGGVPEPAPSAPSPEPAPDEA